MCAYCILNTYDLTLRSRALSINDYFVFHQTETVFDGVNMLACTDLSLQNKFLSLLGGAKPFECGRTYSYLEIHDAKYIDTPIGYNIAHLFVLFKIIPIRAYCLIVNVFAYDFQLVL